MSFIKEKNSHDSPQHSIVDKPTSNYLESAGPTYDKRNTARLLRKLDWNIVPFLALLYLWATSDISIIILYWFFEASPS